MKVDVFIKKIDNLIITHATTIVVMTPNCEICRVPRHITVKCQFLVEPTIYHVNCAQGIMCSNTYNPGWRHYPNFSYKNNNALFAPGFQGQQEALVAHVASQKSNLKLMKENFIVTQT